jgi:ABC-type ATPase involved in cell division
MFIVIGTHSREISDRMGKERRAELNLGTQIEDKMHKVMELLEEIREHGYTLVVRKEKYNFG